jgi:hypothetical protein
MSVFWNAILCYLLFNDSETGETVAATTAATGENKPVLVESQPVTNETSMDSKQESSVTKKED